MNAEAIGRMVRLRAYGDEVIERRIVAVDGSVLYVCRQDEWEAAQAERREPRTVGFRMTDQLMAEPRRRANDE